MVGKGGWGLAMVASAEAEVTPGVAELLDALLAAGFSVSVWRTPAETVVVDVRQAGRVVAHGCGATVLDALRYVVRYLPEVQV